VQLIRANAAVDSYSILAPNAVPAGFVDGKVASEKVLAALDLGDNYRIGHTKVFFKAGILGQLEEMREEKLSSIFANFQARIRGYLIRKNYTKLCDQRSVGSQWRNNCPCGPCNAGEGVYECLGPLLQPPIM